MLVGLLGLALAAVAPFSTPNAAEQRLGAAFVEALRSGTPGAFAALSATRDIGGGPWESVRDTLERYHDVTVDEYRVAPAVLAGEPVIELDLVGSGIRNNAAQQRLPIPALWYLRPAPGGATALLAGADTELRSWVRALVAAPDDAARTELVAREPCVDLHEAARLLEAGLNAVKWSSSDHQNVARHQGAIGFLLGRARAEGDAALEARCLAMLAITQGEPEGPENARLALTVAERSGNAEAIAIARHMGAYRLRGTDPTLAVTLAAKAAAMVEALDDPRPAMGARSNYSLWQQRAGNSREALLSAETLAAEVHRFRAMHGEGVAQERIAAILEDLGQSAAAAERYRLAAAAFHAVGRADEEAMGLSNLARLDVAAGRVRQGLAYQAKAVALGRGHLDEWYFQQYVLTQPVDALLARGHVAEAAALLPSHIGAAAAAVATAEVRLAQGRPADALTALSVFSSTDDPDDSWRSRLLAARAHRQLGKSREAEGELRDAIAFLEARRASLTGEATTRARYLDDRLSPFRELVDLLVAEGRDRDGFVALERMRAQSLEEMLVQARVDPALLPTTEEAAREKALESRLTELNRDLLGARHPAAALREELATARRELELFEAELYVRHPERGRSGVPPSDPLAAAAEALAPGATALEYAVLDRSTVLFVVERSSRGVEVSAHRIAIRRSQLERRVNAFVSPIERRDPAFEGPARLLYDLLVAPARLRIGAAASLCLLPDGPLWRLPFPLLRDARGRELVERVAIFRAPSLSVLAHVRRRRAEPAAESVLAMGNPAIGADTAHRVHAVTRDADLGALPEAEREVATIGKLYGRRAEVHVGTVASERLLKEEAGRFDVIHLATHALIDDAAPLYSALVLAAAPGDGEDGLLEMREISRLPLHARLVVLSACDTARGRISSGEGVIGMSWAFMAAGVPTVVASDWKADSAATEQLMIRFHRELLRGQPTETALRTAQLALRDDPRYAHPYYWAAFEVVGDGW